MIFTRATIIELFVLKLVALEPLPVIELAPKFKEMKIPIPLVTLYKALQSLHAAGYVTKTYEELDIGAPRKCFVCTENGRKRIATLETEWNRLFHILRRVRQTKV